MTSTTLTREALLASKPETFEVNWNGKTCKARKLTQVQFSEFNAWQLNNDGTPNKTNLARRQQRLVAMCLLNPDETLMFPGGDWELLNEVDAETITNLWNQLAEKCGLAKKGTPVKNLPSDSDTTTD